MSELSTNSDDLALAWNQVIATVTPLNLGPWSMVLRGDEVADISHNGTLVLRSIRVVVRDGNWGTPPPVVGSASIEETADSITVRLDVRHTEGDVDFSWTGILRVSPDKVHFGFDGTAHNAFLSNRIGFTVLHPPRLAGHEVAVIHPDGSTETVLFTEEISPHQPAKNIAGMRWSPESPATDFTAELDFSGDIFETEDQRNWTDASFKTYSTPLEIPFPVRRVEGEKVDQTVTLRCVGGEAQAVRTTQLVVDDEPSARIVPELTLGASTAPARASALASARASAEATTSTSFATGVLVELNLVDANWPAALDRAVLEAAESSLDVRLIAAHPDEVAPALDALSTIAVVPVSRLAVFDRSSHLSEPVLWDALVAGVAERSITAELVGGTRGYFTELNRTHERLPSTARALTFSITPQMHSIDREQIVESIGVQRTVALNARRIAAGRSLHIGPVTLRARFNAVATDSAERESNVTLSDGYGPHRVAGSTDSRQQSRAVAAWLVASVDALTVPDVRSICYFETWGPRGIIPTDGARMFPAAIAMGWLTELRGESLLSFSGERSENVAVLATRTNDGSLRILASNLSDTAQLLRVDLGGGTTVLGTLDTMLPNAEGSWGISSRPVAATAGVLILEIPAADVVRWHG